MDDQLTKKERLSEIRRKDAQFGLSVWQAVQKNEMDWIRLQMEYEKHVQQVIALWIENKSKWLDYVMKEHAFERFKQRERELKKQKRKANTLHKRIERHLAAAIKVLRGRRATKAERVAGWRALSKFIENTFTVFPATDGKCFSPRGPKYTSQTTVLNVIDWMRETHRVIRVDAPELSYILAAIQDARSYVEKKGEAIIGEIESIENKISKLQKGQWEKAGVVTKSQENG